MRIELALVDRSVNETELLAHTFCSARKNIGGFCIPSGLISHLGEYKDTIRLSSLIDFPFGLADSSVREHEVIKSIRNGAKTVDITLNNFELRSFHYQVILDEIKTLVQICKENNTELRIILEYRLYDEDQIVKICHYLASSGVGTVVVGSGTILDDPIDNIIIAQQLNKKCGLNVICCSSLWLKRHVQLLKDTKIYGMRLVSVKQVENIFGKIS